MALSKDDIREIAYQGGFNDLERELARLILTIIEDEPVAYVTYKGYLLHAADPKVSEYSEPTPLYVLPDLK